MSNSSGIELNHHVNGKRTLSVLDKRSKLPSNWNETAPFDESLCYITLGLQIYFHDILFEQAKNLMSEILGKCFAVELWMPINIVLRYVGKVPNHLSISISSQLLVKIVEHYPTQSHLQTVPMYRSTITSNKKLVQYFFEDIEYFK